MPACVRCGADISETERDCPRCGADQYDASGWRPATQPRRSTAPYIVLTLVLLVGLAGLLVALTQESDHTTSTRTTDPTTSTTVAALNSDVVTRIDQSLRDQQAVEAFAYKGARYGETNVGAVGLLLTTDMFPKHDNVQPAGSLCQFAEQALLDEGHPDVAVYVLASNGQYLAFSRGPAATDGALTGCKAGSLIGAP